MSQVWTDDVYAGGHTGATDLQNMENNFACLKSLFSGSSSPSSPVAGMPWFDTTKKVCKQRNAGDSAWVGLMHGDTSQKIWVYRNSAMDGWAVDSSVTDRVLALKGGATYTTGAANAGTWTQPDHTLLTSEIPSHTHTMVTGNDHGDTNLPLKGANAVSTATTDSSGGGGAHNHGTTYRPAAAVGTLQYLDL